MLRSFREIVGYSIHASDGELGTVEDLLFDNDQMSIQFLTADSGRVLVQPEEIGSVDHLRRTMTVFSDLRSVRERTVSEKLLVEMSRYLGGLPPAEAGDEPGMTPGLRRAGEALGFHVQASDGLAGHLVDLVIDAREWIVRFIVVDPSEWMPGPSVLVPAESIGRIDRSARLIDIDLDRAGVTGCRPYTGDSLAAGRR